MIISTRDQVNRLTPQHEHGLVSGRLAQDWRDELVPDGFDFDTLLAFALHDYAWVHADDSLSFFGEETPKDFEDYPLVEKSSIYGDGLDRVETISPYAAFLGSLHYHSFLKHERLSAYHSQEARRRERLREELDKSEEQVSRAQSYLRYFDNLSLILCLAVPEAQNTPIWLHPNAVADSSPCPPHRLNWLNNSELAITPFPYDNPRPFAIKGKSLPREELGKRADWIRCWEETPWTTQTLWIVPGS